MIGITSNKRGVKVLTINTYMDVDSNVDILAEYFDCMYIKATTPQVAENVLLGVSPILSYKCSYKAVLMSKSLRGKMGLVDYLVDGYTDDINSEDVMDAVDRIAANRNKYNIKSEITRPVSPNSLFANILRYHLSRDNRIVDLMLIEKSSLGYINPIFERYHSLGMFHLREMFVFEETMLEYGALRVYKYVTKEHLCPKCNHSHLIYTECCPKCGSSNLQLENIIHHFRCANVSSESTYNKGGMLICPKCHRQLRHIGVDYDRPATIYSCKTCGNSFSSPLTKATCCYCEKTSDVQNLIPRDVVYLEITAEGIRALTQGGVNFSQFVNMYDNFMEYNNFINRVKRQITEIYVTDPLCLMVGKIWILNSNKETIKIPDSIQGHLCRLLPNHKVSYNNNIFYVGNLIVGDEEPTEEEQSFRNDLSRVIHRLRYDIEPGQRVCYMVDIINSGEITTLEEYIHVLGFVAAIPDDSYGYADKEEVVKPKEEEPYDFEPKESEEDKAESRRQLRHKRIVNWMIGVSVLLLLIAGLCLLILV